MSTRLRGVLVILAAMACGSARGQDVPKGEVAFTEYIAAEFRREMGGDAVVVKGPLTLTVGGMQANLGRIFNYCSRSAKAGCAREISTYVSSIAQLRKDGSAPPSKHAIRVLVRTRTYVTASQAALSKEALQPRELAGDLVMLPAVDMPRTVRLLSEKDNQALGLSADEVFKLGLANLRTHLKPLMEVAKVARSGQIGFLDGDVYHSSRLALHESWSPLAKAHGGKLIVAAPATDVVLYSGDDAPVAINALRLVVTNFWARAPNQLSTELFRWTPKGWELVR